MLKLELVIKLIASENRIRANVDARNESSGVHRVIPGIAVVNDVLCPNAISNAFEIAPNVYSRWKSYCVRMFRGEFTILRAEVLTGNPVRLPHMLNRHQRQASLQNM